MEGPPRLDSWKEIAAYLNRSASTCRRWEEELGLPVHRLDGTPKARVFAFPAELDLWMAEKLRLGEALDRKESGTPSRKRSWALALPGSVLVLAGLAFAAWRLFFLPMPVPFNNPWLAVLPFDNPAGDAGLAPWTTAFPDLLTTDLRQSRFINVLALTEVDLSLKNLTISPDGRYSPDDVVKIVRDLDVDYAVTGSLVPAGDDLVVSVKVFDGKGRLRSSETRSGKGEASLLTLVDRFGPPIKRAAQLASRAISADIDRPAVKISTASPEAFKLFSQGYRLLNRGDLEESFRTLQKAVDIDPGFGLAHKTLFLAGRRAHRPDELEKYAAEAFRLKDRMSERERLLFEAAYYDSPLKQDQVRALRVNEELWSDFPDYPEAPGGILYLPRIYYALEEYDKMIAAYERMGPRRRRQSGDPFSLEACCLAAGRFETAEKFIREFAALNPGRKDISSILRADLLFAQGRVEEALALDREAPGPDGRPSNQGDPERIGYDLWAMDDFAGAERVYGAVADPADLTEESFRLQNLAVVALSRGQIGRLADLARRGLEGAVKLADDSRQASWRYILALALRLSGALPEALTEVDEALRQFVKLGSRALPERQLKALITLELGRDADFDRQAEEVRSILEPDPNQRLMRAYFCLLGQRALRKGSIEEARGHFWKALDLLPGIHQGLNDGDPVRHLYNMAAALARGGSDAEAVSYYEKVVRTMSGRSWSGDLYAESFFGMGQAYERLMAKAGPSAAAGLRSKAIENYRRFLDLWKDADPIFPEVPDAKGRLAALESSPPKRP